LIDYTSNSVGEAGMLGAIENHGAHGNLPNIRLASSLAID
jgi:hypothetical protein